MPPRGKKGGAKSSGGGGGGAKKHGTEAKAMAAWIQKGKSTSALSSIVSDRMDEDVRESVLRGESEELSAASPSPSNEMQVSEASAASNSKMEDIEPMFMGDEIENLEWKIDEAQARAQKAIEGETSVASRTRGAAHRPLLLPPVDAHTAAYATPFPLTLVTLPFHSPLSSPIHFF